MHPFTAPTLIPIVIALCGTAALSAEPQANPANTISLEVANPDSFRNFSPELPQMRARAAQVNTEFGLHVSEIDWAPLGHPRDDLIIDPALHQNAR